MGKAEGRQEENEAGRPGGSATGSLPGAAEGDRLALGPHGSEPVGGNGRPVSASPVVKGKSLWREYAEAIVIAIILALFIRTFVVQAFKIPSGSMIQTLQIGDHILVNKMVYGVKIPWDCEWDLTTNRTGVNRIPLLWSCYSYKTLLPVSNPDRGDIIVFMFPEDETKDFIKRVVGLPGETVEIRDKKVYINGRLMSEPFTQHVDRGVVAHHIQPRDNLGPITVPPESYFVMGDNRDQSLDSRFWGYVKREKIKGKAFLIYWSWDGRGDLVHWVRWDRIAKIIR